MPAYHAIVERWGQGVTAPDGPIDRRELRQRVFSDSEQLEALNAIVHPEVQRLRDQLVDDAAAAAIASSSVTFPCSSSAGWPISSIAFVLVDAPRPVRMERLVRDRGIEATEA